MAMIKHEILLLLMDLLLILMYPLYAYFRAF